MANVIVIVQQSNRRCYCASWLFGVTEKRDCVLQTTTTTNDPKHVKCRNLSNHAAVFLDSLTSQILYAILVGSAYLR